MLRPQGDAFLISTGLAELVLIGLSILVGLPSPLLAVQILWLNLVTNGIQDVALAFEAGGEGRDEGPATRAGGRYLQPQDDRAGAAERADHVADLFRGLGADAGCGLGTRRWLAPAC